MIFIGRYYHALEQKGRLSIPSAFRSKLGENAVLTAGLDGCLFLVDEAQWQGLIKAPQKAAVTKKHTRDWTRYLANNAVEVEFDANGRVLIPEHLRQAINLTKNAVIVGSLNRIEIWDRDTYHQYLETVLQNMEDITESMETENE